MKTPQEQVLDIREDLAGNGMRIGEMVQAWAKCRSPVVTSNGRIWVEFPQTGHWLDDDKLVEFVTWVKDLEANR